MKIKYINGMRLYYAFLAGGDAVIQDKDYLNKINVFPVPDADTGTNMAATMRSIAESSVVSSSIKTTLRSIADAALTGARGNSGLIFAQFIQGISQEIKNDLRLTTHSFGESVRAAVQHVYKSIVFPVEGTMLTVIKDWADSVYHHRTKTSDFVELLTSSLQAAKKSLLETPKKLSVLAKAGVVDAGAKGFVDFIEGILNFTRIGRLRGITQPKAPVEWTEPKVHAHSRREEVKQRYCAEASLDGKDIDLDAIRKEIQAFGESAIVAGSSEKTRFHVHTNSAAELFFRLKDFGTISQIKVDDMLKQYEVSHNRKADIALVTDSSCDLPQDVIDDCQIQVIPFNLSFGDSLFLDKLTITPEQFYSLLETHPEHPKTALPAVATVQSLFSFLSSFYDSLIVFHISGGLSGTFSSSLKAAEKFPEKKISVIDSKNLSVSLGLIVQRAAKAIQSGMSHDEVVEKAGEWISKTRVLVDIQTLKYMVKGGRVSPAKGFIAKVLNVKPIISLDEEGKAAAVGKSFSRRGNMKKILRMIQEMSDGNNIWNYAIVHAKNLRRAKAYAEKLKEATGREPAYVMDVSPVIGAHNGIGVVGMAVMLK